jgi:aryl-alcohol dehydrogenase-like predicted oxidoreductase|tara:strand:+ start:1374 stop:2321 length:948 start_codon:yes stop_codon:yes gene_type:complete
MKYRQFKKSGLYVSEIGIGTNRFGHNVDQKDVNKIIHYCLDEGINYIDTANTYANGKSEESLGNAFDNNRKSFIIGTKVGWPNDFDANQGLLSSKSLFWHVDQSLVKLNTDYIDILWLHKWDEDTPIIETLNAISILIKQGKIRYLGISNFNSWQTSLIATTASIKYDISIISIQSEYNLLKRDTYLDLKECIDYLDLSFIPYFPLASGFLTGKYSNNHIPSNSRGEWATYMKNMLNKKHYQFLDELRLIADNHEISLTELSISWLLNHENITSVICGVRNVDQLKLNSKSINCKLTYNDNKIIEKIFNKHFVLH